MSRARLMSRSKSPGSVVTRDEADETCSASVTPISFSFSGNASTRNVSDRFFKGTFYQCDMCKSLHSQPYQPPNLSLAGIERSVSGCEVERLVHSPRISNLKLRVLNRAAACDPATRRSRSTMLGRAETFLLKHGSVRSCSDSKIASGMPARNSRQQRNLTYDVAQRIHSTLESQTEKT